MGILKLITGKKLFLIQKPMMSVCYALTPIVLFSIYLFGWRSLFLILVILFCGIASEAVFTLRHGNPVTSAVFVTCMIFSLSLPPTVPFWMAIVGIITGVVFGKMVFGGFGRNVFNPAMVGRCFIYIAFPAELTNHWVKPIWGGLGGFASWTTPVDAVTGATPLGLYKEGITTDLFDLFIGNVSGSMGETSAILIILGGMYLIIKKAASWELALSCIMGGVAVSYATGLLISSPVPLLLHTLCSGAFLFGAAFVVTEPVSGAKSRTGKWIYGFFVGALTIILRQFSNFIEGIMFSVLLMNAFVPLIDHTVSRFKKPERNAK